MEIFRDPAVEDSGFAGKLANWRLLKIPASPLPSKERKVASNYRLP